MATNAERAEALRTALATGVKSVTVDGITTTFQDASQIREALALFEPRAATDGGEIRVRRVAVGVTSGIQRCG